MQGEGQLVAWKGWGKRGGLAMKVNVDIVGWHLVVKVAGSVDQDCVKMEPAEWLECWWAVGMWLDKLCLEEFLQNHMRSVCVKVCH